MWVIFVDFLLIFLFNNMSYERFFLFFSHSNSFGFGSSFAKTNMSKLNSNLDFVVVGFVE